MTDWKPISSGRIMCRDDGFVVIKPVDAARNVPFECQHCGLMMREARDPECHMKHGCCSRCTTRWVDANRTRWAEGWRPAPEEVTEQVKLWSL